MNIAAYRRTYFALCKQFGLDTDARHDFNRAQTGKASTTTWTVADWRDAVAELQRRNGQDVKPGRPRIRSRRGGEDGNGITPAQLELIANLQSQITWTIGADAFIRARLLHPFRREHWDGRLESLTRREAANVITVFRSMAECGTAALGCES